MAYQIRLFGAFAIAALLLAATGIFAMIAHNVSERRPELGIRMALGASPLNVVIVVARRRAGPAIVGLVAAVSGVTRVVSLVATSLAARRALAIRSSEALRGG